MTLPKVQELVLLLEEAEAQQGAAGSASPHARAEAEAIAAGFTPSQVSRAQVRYQR